jgi:hypothetical protein
MALNLKNIGLKTILKTVLTKVVAAVKWLVGKVGVLGKVFSFLGKLLPKKTAAAAAPATGAAAVVAKPGWFGWTLGCLRTFAMWPAIVLVSAYLFVHALAFFSLDDWLGWHIAVVVWWMLAGAVYYVLVFVDHEATQTAIVWVTKGMVLSCIAAYSWHYGATKNDAANAGLQFQVMYAEAASNQCAARLAKYERPQSVQGIVTTALPPPKAAPAPVAAPVAATPPAAKVPARIVHRAPKKTVAGSLF